jgi:hypothetical protein
MAEAYFNVRVHLYNATVPPTAVQLYGGPLGTIISMTIYENDIDDTSGVLPKGSPIASLLASPGQFQEVCEALNAGGVCTLCISFEVDENHKRQVNSISVQAPVLLAIERGVDRTANTAEEIYEILDTNLKKVVTELTKTNQILLERLPDGGGKGPNGGTSTSPPPLDDDCEEPAHHA